mgnify:CR=1 FL=1
MKLFKAFGKLKDPNALNPAGVGLGMNISQRNVLAMGGEIKIQSEVNKGTKFKFDINVLVKNENYNATQDKQPFDQTMTLV